MAKTWPVVDASGWEFAGVEPQGMHQHEWYRLDTEPRTWLFKRTRASRHRAFGEEIAEKLAAEIAVSMGVPSARVELAQRENVRGALVEDVRPHGWAIQHGQTLLSGAIPDYDPGNPEQRGHNPDSIRDALRGFGPPPASTVPPTFSAFDVFVGYLVFDALIAHGDRHDRNWAVLLPPSGDGSPYALCASFDHAASLGFTLFEPRCAQLLRDDTVGQWASKAKATRFEHVRRSRWQSLVELAASASRLCDTRVRHHWRENVASVDRDSVSNLVYATPDLTRTTRDFVVELVMVNQRRLIHALG